MTVESGGQLNSNPFAIEPKSGETPNSSSLPFVERRVRAGAFFSPQGERRQFGNSYHTLSPEGRELAEAIDRYKIAHRRRFISCDELLEVIQGLGYRKTSGN
ncbi:MAG: hypothetical protein KatS3mg110_1865 [Pirellulaceae bacterium]|nr:MAG: hypothetical protein KatS3mg110_1865 [Pirellulaceae bacterium]